MSGTCVDNPVLNITGCGAVYGGEIQHSVASVPWSTLPDGKAHITGKLSTIERCWGNSNSRTMRNPAKLPGFWLDERGVWRRDRLPAIHDGSQSDAGNRQVAMIPASANERAA